MIPSAAQVPRIPADGLPMRASHGPGSMRMGIDRTDGPGRTGRPTRAGDARVERPGRPDGPAQGADRLELSPRAVEIDRLRTAAETLPEIRQERVDAIREQIRLGRYGVDAEKLARLLVDADVL